MIIKLNMKQMHSDGIKSCA